MDVKKLKLVFVLLITVIIFSCTTMSSIGQADKISTPIIEVDIANSDIGISAKENFDDFSKIPSNQQRVSFRKGDIINITIWEASPGFLFNSANKINNDSISGSASINSVPSQPVDQDGKIYVPYVGRFNVEDLSVPELEELVISQLRGKANNPQVQVNANYLNSQINIIGNIATPGKYELNPLDNVLDFIAKAGGVKGNEKDTLVSLIRDKKIYSSPLIKILEDPEYNISLNYGDSLIFSSKPKKAVFLGALNSNQTVEFGPNDINLLEAISKAYGLNDQRANSKRIYIFRPNENISTLFSIDLSDTGSFMYASNFYIKDGDIIVVTNNSLYEGQKALSIIGAMFSPISGYLNAQNLQNASG